MVGDLDLNVFLDELRPPDDPLLFKLELVELPDLSFLILSFLLAVDSLTLCGLLL